MTLCFFLASVHLVLLAVVLHRTWSLAQFIRRFNWRTVDSSGAEDSAVKTLLLASSRPWDEPLLTHQFIWCYCSSKPLLSVLISQAIGRPTVPSLRPSVHPVLRLLLLHFFHSSDACRNWTVGSSDGASWLNPLRSVPRPPTLASRVPSVHLTVSFSFLFFHGFDPWKIHYLLIWHVVFLHPLD
jgi:hypothetical protein